MSKKEKRYQTFQEFWPFYISQHSNIVSRRLHYVGTSMGIILALYFVFTQQFFMIPLGFIPGYACAWVGHFVFEKNKPATFTYPLWSLMGDFKMLFYFLTGKPLANS